MQTVQVRCLNYSKLNYDVPASIEEFDRLAARTGAALDEANKNVIYRAVLNQARDGFLHGLDEEKDAAGNITQAAVVGLDKLTGIDRKVKISKPEVKDAEGKITQEEVSAWDEKETVFADRVFATLTAEGKFASAEAAAASFEPLMQQVLAAISFDPKKTARESSGPKKPTKTAFGIADALIELAGSVEAAVAKFNAKTGRSSPATRDGLAFGIWEDQKSQNKIKQVAGEYAS